MIGMITMTSYKTKTLQVKWVKEDTVVFLVINKTEVATATDLNNTENLVLFILFRRSWLIRSWQDQTQITKTRIITKIRLIIIRNLIIKISPHN